MSRGFVSKLAKLQQREFCLLVGVPKYRTICDSSLMTNTYDALLIVGFGGPEKPDDVMPFLENVTRGRNIPRERLLDVAKHYDHFGGVSPINQQVRDLIAVLRPALENRGIDLPIFWGNRNWHPMLPEAMQSMIAVGVRRALAIVLAGYSSYSSCRQYRENIESARQTVGNDAPVVDKLRVFFNHPDFIQANVDRIQTALQSLPAEVRGSAHIAFTAHSIPTVMANNCRYAEQLTETSRLISERLKIPVSRWKLVYQSRSGRPTDPWLEPDILDHLTALKNQSASSVVVAPVGFLSDHVEVLWDLDDEAVHKASELGLPIARAGTVGTHPKFVSMLAELVVERMSNESASRDASLTLCERRAIGHFGPSHDVCPVDCCSYSR